MNFFELIKSRRSVRVFKKQKMEKEKLIKILEAANSAPSAGDLQSYEIYLIKSQEMKEQLSKAALGQSQIANAAAVLVFCASSKRALSKYGGRGTELYSIQDATIACAYAQLAVTELGLSSVWVGAFYEKEVANIIKSGPQERPVALLPIGYPAKKPNATPRRQLKELVHEEGEQ